MPKEHWKPVVGYEGYYEVSSEGRVRSVHRTLMYKNKYGDITPRSYKGKMLSTKPGASGYPRLTLTKGGVHKDANVHQLVMESFVGPCPEGKEVCHNNHDATDCSLGNLRYGTHHENMHDRFENGTYNLNMGSKNGFAKLTEDEARLVIANLDSKTNKEIATELLGDKVTGDAIQLIRKGERWSHIPRTATLQKEDN